MNKLNWTLMALIAGCGGGGGPDDIGTVDTMNPSAFCRAAAQTGCLSIFTCLTDAERMAEGFPATQAECERRWESNCESAVEQCDNSANRGYSSTMAASCLTEMQNASCADAAEPYLDGPSCDNVCALTQGTFQVRWAFSPSSYTCSSVNATTVNVVSTGPGNMTYTDRFDCYVGQGTTEVLPVGAYSVRIELYDPSNKWLWSSPTVTTKLDKEFIDLGTVTIPVSSQ